MRMQKFYLTFCDILYVAHLHFSFFNNVFINLTTNLDHYFKIAENVKNDFLKGRNDFETLIDFKMSISRGIKCK